MGKFSQTVSTWATKSLERAQVVRAEAIQDLVEIMLEPGPSVANPSVAGHGRLPIDTGFLRASFVARRGRATLPVTFPPPPPKNGAPPVRANFDVGPVGAIIAETPLKETITLGFTANYARHANYGARGRPGYLFVELALQQWPQIVRRQERLVSAALNRRARGLADRKTF